ncbi:hypothetical protein [Croceimicrobium hydrocarbonivorans]|uniref:Outer membrane protein beta-barrel domain-containing protein n=1 Tax=Croceimicrobium hydrocarbonivorans TaxID=2761580 RepID=A0A7H0VDZ5_9FLAO|nr:hypothetical protein [Croceimicrobium hydrocarbonivorans]QNR23943.1 hypothetical protein H4K34_16450 [Croceimicrobium hydrocarbonivorans]
MRKTLILFGLLFISQSALKAQQNSESRNWTSFGGVQVANSSPMQQLALWVGGQGAVQYKDYFALGGFGMGAVNSMSVSGLAYGLDQELNLNMGYGGLFIESVQNKEHLYIPGLRLPFAVGGVSLKDALDNKVAKSTIYVFSPRLNWDFNISPHAQIGFYGGYQLIWAENDRDFKQEDLSSWEYGINLKLGFF